MSGEETSTSRNNNDVPYDYGDKKAESGKVPRFNRDPEEFSWWKTNFYIYVMGLDEELWDILEDGVGDLVLEEEGDTIVRKKHIHEQKKLYKKHHKIRRSLVTTIPKVEYMKMSDKSTAKGMFASLCANYEGSQKSRTFVEEIFLITSKAKQRCLYSVHTNRTSPMTGASQFRRRFRENKVKRATTRVSQLL